MWLVIIGLLLCGLKLAGIGPFAEASWWWYSLPFLAAALWWKLADDLGFTRAGEMRKLDERKQERRNKQLAQLGIDPERDRNLARARAAARQLKEGAAAGKDLQPDGGKKEPRL
jgi:small Trp-rich protein